jgi:diadenosine tetraphosphate (Ap4A) HIT family hydrolase
MKNALPRLAWLGVLLMAFLAAGCLGALTPHAVDVETLPPEQQEIVAEAMNFLATSRMEFQSPPQVILVKRKGSSWQVVFEGDMHVVPPDPMHTLTPGPFTHQCAYIIIDPITNRNALRSQPCPKR